MRNFSFTKKGSDRKHAKPFLKIIDGKVFTNVRNDKISADGTKLLTSWDKYINKCKAKFKV
jgi:hypothetical protein